MASLPGFLWLIGLALGASASTPRSSLLEVKSNAHKASVSVEMQSNKARLAEYSKFTEGMLAKYGQDDATDSESGSGLPVEDGAADNGLRHTIRPNGTEFDAVRTVLNFIHDMGVSLQTYHDQDLDLATRCSHTNILSSCEADYLNDTTKQNLQLRSETITTQSVLHKGCREDAKTCYDQMIGSCPDYDKYRKQLSPYQETSHNLESYQDSSLPDCVRTSPDDDASESSGTAGAFSDRSIKTDQEDQLAAMEQCLKTTKAWLDPLYRRYDQCRRSAQECGDELATCKTLQQEFEDAHCQWKIEQGVECEGVDTCGQGDTDRCTGVCADIKVRERYRNADNQTGLRLVCLLNVIFGTPVDSFNDETEWYPPPANKTTALAACKDGSAYQDPAAIQCNPGAWEKPAPCVDVIYQTCSADFNARWYTNEGLALSCNGEDRCSLVVQGQEKRIDLCQASGSCTD